MKRHSFSGKNLLFFATCALYATSANAQSTASTTPPADGRVELRVVGSTAFHATLSGAHGRANCMADCAIPLVAGPHQLQVEGGFRLEQTLLLPAGHSRLEVRSFHSGRYSAGVVLTVLGSLTTTGGGTLVGIGLASGGGIGVAVAALGTIPTAIGLALLIPGILQLSWSGPYAQVTPVTTAPVAGFAPVMLSLPTLRF